MFSLALHLQPTKENIFKSAVSEFLKKSAEDLSKQSCSAVFYSFSLFFFLNKPVCLLCELLMALWREQNSKIVFLSLSPSTTPPNHHPGHPRLPGKAANTKRNLQLVHTNVCIFQAQRGDVEGNFLFLFFVHLSPPDDFPSLPDLKETLCRCQGGLGDSPPWYRYEWASILTHNNAPLIQPKTNLPLNKHTERARRSQVEGYVHSCEERKIRRKERKREGEEREPLVGGVSLTERRYGGDSWLNLTHTLTKRTLRISTGRCAAEAATKRCTRWV